MVTVGGASTDRARAVAKTSALLGALAWAALVLAAPHDAVTRWTVERWVLLAVLVYVPAGTWAVGEHVVDELAGRAYRAAAWLQPAGAVAVVASAFVPGRVASGALASAWLLVTGALAAFGLLRLRAHGGTPLSALLVDAGFAYAVVGAVALVLSRLEVALIFRPVIVHLTAIHYHYAGFVLPVVAGLTGRFVEAEYPADSLRRQVYRASGATVLVGMVVIAVGITASPTVEVVSVSLFTVAVAAFAALSLAVLPDLYGALTERGDGRPRALAVVALVAVASASVVATMAYAVGYGWSAYTGETVVSLSTMLTAHGTVNALGFAGAGLAGWLLAAQPSRARRVDATFSTLRSRWRVGADYPERTGTVADESPPGQLDALEELAAPGFDASAVDPAIRRFYERTDAYALSYDLDWHAPFRTGARLAAPVTESLGQLALPAPGDDGPHHTDGRIVGVAPEADPRESARFWVRTAGADTDGTPPANSVFVAAYALHAPDADPERTYVNVGLPLPASNLTAVLAPGTFDAGDGRVGLELTSRGPNDEGLYLATALGAIGVPMHERFRVWPADAPDAPDHVDLAPADTLDAGSATETDADDGADAGTDADPDVLVATHEMWLLDSQFLTIRYVVYPDREHRADAPAGEAVASTDGGASDD